LLRLNGLIWVYVKEEVESFEEFCYIFWQHIGTYFLNMAKLDDFGSYFLTKFLRMRQTGFLFCGQVTKTCPQKENKTK
jgi:hypothetical protein